MTKKRFAGVISVLYTMFTEKGRIDAQGVQCMVDYQIESGVDGIMILGSAGENAYLSSKERKDMIKATLTAVRGRVPVVVGSSSFGTDEAVRLSLEAEEMGCSAHINLLPVYFPLKKSNILKHYEVLSKRLSQPLFYYHFPSCSHYDLTVDEFVEILSLDNIIGAKVSKLSMTYLKNIIQRTKEKNLERTVLTGLSLVMYQAMQKGADGVMCPHVCHWPTKCLEIYRMFQSGKYDEARQAQKHLYWFSPLYGAGQHSPAMYEYYWKLRTGWLSSFFKMKGNSNALQKEALRQMGYPVTAIVKSPLPTLTNEGASKVTTLLKNAGLYESYSTCSNSLL